MTLSQEGRHLVNDDPEMVLHAAHSSDLPDVHCMGLYAVLGDHDFITILEAPDNEAAARFSLELGVKVGLDIQTVPAIPVSRLDHKMDWLPSSQDLSSPSEPEEGET